MVGEGKDVEYIFISKSKASDIIEGVLDASDLDDLMSSGASRTESGAVSGRIHLNGAETDIVLDIKNFDASEAIELDESKSKWVLVREQWQIGVFMRMEINENFDSRLLTCEGSFYSLRGVRYGFLDFTYGGESGEWGDTSVNSEAMYLIDPKGQVHNIDGGSDSGAQATPQKKTVECCRAFKFPSKDKYDNFKMWIGEELQPRIDEGLSDITKISFDDERLSVTFYGPEIDLGSLPSPDMLWCKKQFGAFKRGPITPA